MYPCSENCINRICDRFNGSCMCNLQDGEKHHQGMLCNEISYIQYSQNDQNKNKTSYCVYCFSLCAKKRDYIIFKIVDC